MESRALDNPEKPPKNVADSVAKSGRIKSCWIAFGLVVLTPLCTVIAFFATCTGALDLDLHLNPNFPANPFLIPFSVGAIAGIIAAVLTARFVLSILR